MDEREILRIAAHHDIDEYLTEALTLEFVRDVLKAARRTTPDREAWISVAERLPESPGDYLLFRPAAHLPPASDPNITIREFFGRGKVGGDRFGGAHAVTHWMPLPTAPTSDKGGA
ncbi:TPA: DUF551 domain-containing protein [Burkholderia multivorans]|nr:DUF551 domain-containing protein [Burkholderia multivorans]HEM7871820.1 DUF551 domain-containing protein [Burkholderia multivorans]HEM7907381.1 DUF551 domain-containing protein [Burkholderia multivorans]HEM8538546.1 DUF551 domain-containing protein [Burkholderia multivorans]